MKPKRKSKPSVIPPLQQPGPAPQPTPVPPSRWSGTHFLTGALGQSLAEANDAAEETLQKAGHHPVPKGKQVSTTPFTPDPKRRADMAYFFDPPERRPVIWDIKKFRPEPKPMDEETKMYLKEKGLAKKFLRPKREKIPENLQVTLTKGAKVREGTERAAVLAWLRSNEGTTKMAELDAHFKKSMKGVVGKLSQKGCVTITAV